MKDQQSAAVSEPAADVPASQPPVVKPTTAEFVATSTANIKKNCHSTGRIFIRVVR